MDPFATLGIERTFDIDLAAVEKTHRELSRALHPDRHASGVASERRYALSKAMEVNEAWRIVKDPIRRAEALFRLAGVAVGEANEPKAASELLMDMMEQRESLSEARERHDLAAAREAASRVEARALAAERSLSDAFRSATAHPDLLLGALPRLGELRFYRRFLDEVSELEDFETEEAVPQESGGRVSMALLEIFDPKAPPRPIGIDLGTTNSLVAYVRDGRPVAIKDCDQEVLLPSVVAYGDEATPVVGRLAQATAAQHPRETIVSVKRFMGRGGDNPETRRLGPYEFLPAREGEPNVVRFRVKDRVVTPVEVSAQILRTLKGWAEDELRSVGGAVITVPAYFDDGQRQATKDAGRLAGLDVLRLLNEPTAAALAYGLEKNQNGTFAVYDLGGGTFDITILSLDDGVFQVKSTGGDSALGGDDMDRALAEVLLERGGLGSASAQTPSIVRHALDLARAAKHGLTGADEVEVEVATGASVVVTRGELERLIQPLLERTGVACRRALKDAGIRAAALDGVILVGGSTRVPAVRRYVAELFGKEPLGDIDPEQVVALGAAVQADLLAGSGERPDVLLLDVLPLSLGIEVGGGVVDKILPRNTTIPTAARATYTTQEDRQTGFVIHVVQGERELATDCRSLARFTLKGIPPMAAGMAKLEVTFNVDADGLLGVHARELTTGLEQTVSVKPSYGLDDEAVEKMLLEALDHGEEDLANRRLAEERVEASRIGGATRKALVADSALLDPGEAEAIGRAIDALDAAAQGRDPSRIHSLIEALDVASKEFATRRMNRAIARAIEGRRVDDVQSSIGPGASKE